MDAEQRARLDERAAVTVSPDMPWVQARPILDLRALLAAYDAAVAGRDRYRKRLDEWTDDSLLDGLSDTDLERYGQSSPQELYRWLLAAEARATRLATLEQAAWAWREDQTIEAEAVLCDAIADLDDPPWETP